MKYKLVNSDAVLEVSHRILHIQGALDTPETVVANFYDSPVGEDSIVMDKVVWGDTGFTSSIKRVSERTRELTYIPNEKLPEPTKFLEDVKHIDAVVREAFEIYLEKYGIDYPEQGYIENFGFRQYVADSVGGLGAHRDNGGPEDSRYLVTLNLYLTDTYDGGKLQFHNDFTDQSIYFSIKPKAGDILLFPSEFIHSVEKVKKDNRYNINTLLVRH